MSTHNISISFKFTLLILLILVFASNSFAQAVPPEYVVRVIYFLPSDRTPQPDINTKLDGLIKNTQLFFAEQMTAHGFGQKTFEFEADTAGKLVVHRLNGQFNDAYYNRDTWNKVWQEIEGQFDLSNNIYLTALDTSQEDLDHIRACGYGGGSSLGGRALIPASGDCFNVPVTAHELGHTFGLMHDFRINGRWIPSAYTSNKMITSFCSAEWLDVHRYFKVNQTLSNAPRAPFETLTSSREMTLFCGVGAHDVQHDLQVNQTAPGDAWPTFEMLGNPILAAAPNAIRLRFRVTDADGLHQIRLHTPEWERAGEFLACKRVSGTSATVEFVTTELPSRSESVRLWVIDAHGNFSWSQYYPINITTVLPPATAVSIPDPKLAAAVRQKIGNITTHSLLNLMKLETPDHETIADLTGLESAYNLRHLKVFQGEITDVSPLANLIGVAHLALGEHQIRDISPLRNLTNLESLYLGDNQISDITALGNLTFLETLILWGNQISDITALRNLINLRRLYLDINQISDITALRNLTNLIGLYLGDNQISDITALRNLTSLKTLVIWGNHIRDITALSDLTNLTFLALQYNQITDVRPLVDLINLEELYLAGNPIEDLSPLRILLAKNPKLKIDIDVPQPPSNITLSPSTVPDQTFRVGTPIASLTLPEATGGTAPYTYTLSPLPDGLSFETSTRTLSGTPTTPAPKTSVTYTVIDTVGATASLTFSITVEAAVPPLALSPSAVADQKFEVGKTISALILPEATGGTAPYTYTLSPLPDGLSFEASTRTLSGTPTTPAPKTSVTYTVIDTASATASLTFSITVEAAVPPLALSPSVIADQTFTVGEGVILTLPVATGGTPPYTYTLSPLPEGLSFNAATKLLSGTPTTAETTPTTYTATDAADVSASLTFTITVRAKLTFNPSVVADQTFIVGEGVILTLPVATGGTPPYTYTLAPLPEGLSFNAVGRLLSGTPTTAETTPTTYTATDAADVSASLTFTITVRAKPTFNPSVIADQTFTVGEGVNLTLPVATGGTPPYTYTLAPLPGGLSFNATQRELSGTPTTAETTPTTYTATDAASVSASLTFTIEVTAGVILDVDGDGQVTVIDLAIVALFYGTQVPADTSLPADVNADGIVNILDLTAVAEGIDTADTPNGFSADDLEVVLEAVADQVNAIEGIAEAPARLSTSQPARFSGVAARNVAAAFQAAKPLATNDVRLRKWMPLLKKLLERLREITEIPETTTLLPNYPNPLNPETWIPYHLAKAAHVTLTIYDMRGVSVRELVLGHQPAGVYQSRGRAAYYDGRNDEGEKVSSGVYFYTLTADEFTATRKLLIIK